MASDACPDIGTKAGGSGPALSSSPDLGQFRVRSAHEFAAEHPQVDEMEKMCAGTGALVRGGACA
jgi:hypothetical protein